MSCLHWATSFNISDFLCCFLPAGSSGAWPKVGRGDSEVCVCVLGGGGVDGGKGTPGGRPSITDYASSIFLRVGSELCILWFLKGPSLELDPRVFPAAGTHSISHPILVFLSSLSPYSLFFINASWVISQINHLHTSSHSAFLGIWTKIAGNALFTPQITLVLNKEEKSLFLTHIWYEAFVQGNYLYLTIRQKNFYKAICTLFYYKD